MSSVARYAFRAGQRPSIPGGVGTGSGGGDMEDVLRRLGLLEKDVSVIRTEVAGITAVLPHLATKADVSLVRAEISDAKTSMIQWTVSTVIAVAALVFAIAKFVH
jgi:hypothetical protein